MGKPEVQNIIMYIKRNQESLCYLSSELIIILPLSLIQSAYTQIVSPQQNHPIPILKT